jgi:hypothetical protein
MQKLDVQDLMQKARQRTGLSDFGPADFIEGLRIAASGISSEAGIREDRWDHVRERFLRLLMNRLWFAADLAQHPEILREEVRSPIIIDSLPRTGSTKLHRMLGASRNFQTPVFWTANMFARIPGLADGGGARRIAETRDLEKWMYETSPDILVGHPMFTEEPEEDQWLMECTFRHPLLFGLYDSSSYAQWIAQADMGPTYDYYLAQIKYLQWQMETHPVRPWLLKTPHLGYEPLLARTFDRPRFIVTHRDPVKWVPSIISTAMAMRRLYSDRDSSAELARGIVQVFSNCAQAHLTWRDGNPDHAILDLGFDAITEDGIGTAKKVYEFLGVALSGAAERKIGDWERRNPRDKYGRATYSAVAAGLSEDEIRETFSAYRHRFANYIATPKTRAK